MESQDLDTRIAELVRDGNEAELTELARSSDKATAKAGRRGLHLLRARGAHVEVPIASASVPHATAAPEVSDLWSVASMIDGRGERVVWYVVPHPAGGVRICQAEISDTRGLTAFAHADVSRKKWREQEKRILAEKRLIVSRIPSDHARWLLEEGCRGATEAGRPVPRPFAEMRRMLPPPPPADNPARIHPARTQFSTAPAPTPDELANTQTLHDRDEILAWIPEQAVLAKLDAALGELADSPLVFDLHQRAVRQREVVDRVIAETFDAAERARYQARLLEMALLWNGRGESAVARLGVIVADQLRDEKLLAVDIPFVRRLYEKLIPPVTTTEESDPGRLIVEPGSTLVQPKLPSRPHLK